MNQDQANEVYALVGSFLSNHTALSLLPPDLILDIRSAMEDHAPEYLCPDAAEYEADDEGAEEFQHDYTRWQNLIETTIGKRP